MTILEPRKVKSLLIIDDSPDELGLMRQILATQGYQIELAFSLKSGLIQRVGARPDLIVVNWKPSQIAEVELRSLLREYKSYLNIPILLLSDASDICLQQVVELGADGLLLKPFELDRLLSCIESLLQEKTQLTDVAQEQQIEPTPDCPKTVIVIEPDETDPLSQEQQELAAIQLHNSEQIFRQMLLEKGYQVSYTVSG